MGGPQSISLKRALELREMSENGDNRETTEIRAADRQRVARLMRLATYASVSTAVFLVAAKLAAWALTDSVAILSALIDSLLDVLASLVNLFAVRQALQPADREHRFGHGKAEALAGLAQTAFISGSAIFLVFQAARRLASPAAVENSGFGIAVMVLAIVATFALVTFQPGETAARSLCHESVHGSESTSMQKSKSGSRLPAGAMRSWWASNLAGRVSPKKQLASTGACSESTRVRRSTDMGISSHSARDRKVGRSRGV